MGDYMKKAGKMRFFAGIVFSILTISLIIFIFFNSLQNATTSGQSSGRVMNFLNMICSFIGMKPFFTQTIVRFLAHFCEFGLLGVLLYITFYFYFNKKIRVSIFSCLTVITVAVTDECLQLFSDGRAFQLSDIFIDVCGAFFGIGASALIILIIELIKRKISKVS